MPISAPLRIGPDDREVHRVVPPVDPRLALPVGCPATISQARLTGRPSPGSCRAARRPTSRTHSVTIARDPPRGDVRLDLKVPELLSLQVERSAGADGPEHDELLFIVVHQVYELWFKPLHHELQGVQIALEDGDTDRALHLMNRVLKILKTLVAQVDVLETMTPRSSSRSATGSTRRPASSRPASGRSRRCSGA